MKVYQVLEHYLYEGYATPGDYVYRTKEQADARVAELLKKYPGEFEVFELEVK